MGDYEEICGLIGCVDEYHAAILPQYFQEFSGPARSREYIAAYVEAEDAEILLAEVDGRNVGCLMMKIVGHPDYPMFRPYRFMSVEILVVVQGYRREGIGTRLLDAAREWAEKRGIESCQVHVWVKNRPAFELYQKMGFKTISVRMALDLAKDERLS